MLVEENTLTKRICVDWIRCIVKTPSVIMMMYSTVTSKSYDRLTLFQKVLYNWQAAVGMDPKSPRRKQMNRFIDLSNQGKCYVSFIQD